jgi:hypothetical protein
VLLPISHDDAKLRSISRIGDEEQLAPVVTSEGKNEFGAQAGLSLMKRMQASGVEAVTLDTQYRMDPDVSEIIRSSFYGGILVDADSTRNRPGRAAFLELGAKDQRVGQRP